MKLPTDALHFNATGCFQHIHLAQSIKFLAI